MFNFWIFKSLTSIVKCFFRTVLKVPYTFEILIVPTKKHVSYYIQFFTLYPQKAVYNTMR